MILLGNGSDSSTAKRSAISVSVTGPRKWPLWTDALCHSRCGTLKNPHCSMAMSVEHRSKFSVLHRQWWRLHISEQISSGTKNPKQTNKYHLSKSFICLPFLDWQWSMWPMGLLYYFFIVYNTLVDEIIRQSPILKT